MERQVVEHREQPHVNIGILNGIARLQNPRNRNERHKLTVGVGYNINRRSIQHLVTFVDDRGSHEVAITQLVLNLIHFSLPHDGAVEDLRHFFARSDTTLTKVHLLDCDFGTAQEAAQLLAAFHTNRTVTELAFKGIKNLAGANLGTCISRLLQNTPQLQRLDCSFSHMRVEGVLAFRPALQVNRMLRELNLSYCRLEDAGIRHVADTLVGNTTMQVLDIGYNHFTSNGLDDITRLLESSHLKKLVLYRNYDAFGNVASTQRFARVLGRHEFLKKLDLSSCQLGAAGIQIIAHGLVGNTTMEFLEIRLSIITCNGLDNITRLVESTRLKSIDFRYNEGIFDDETATQRFVTTLQHKQSSVQELSGNILLRSQCLGGTARIIIQNSLTRNRQLNLVNLLLAPPSSLSPPPQQQQQQRSAGGTMLMLKIWHKAITKFARVPNNAGASAIFKLFQARPALLEKRLQRPVVGEGAAADAPTTCAAAATTTAVSQEQKRRRLS